MADSPFGCKVPPSARGRYRAVDIDSPPPHMAIVADMADYAEQPTVVAAGARVISILCWHELAPDVKAILTPPCIFHY
jgi:hypothetical protein